MICRDEILMAAREIIRASGINKFTIDDIVKQMQRKQTKYQISTIRTHVSSRMCANSPNHHAKTFSDFERIENGVYKLIH
jgi:hypothetical protein